MNNSRWINITSNLLVQLNNKRFFINNALNNKKSNLKNFIRPMPSHKDKLFKIL